MSRTTFIKLGLAMAASAALAGCGGGGGTTTPPGGGGGGGSTPSTAAQISSGFETIFNTASTGAVVAVSAGALPPVNPAGLPIDF